MANRKAPAKLADVAIVSHVPRRGLYGLADKWRERDDAEVTRKYNRAKSEARLHQVIQEEMAYERGRGECADELERAIAELPINEQHLEAMLRFDQQSIHAIRALEKVAAELQWRQDSINTLVNNLLVQISKNPPRF